MSVLLHCLLVASDVIVCRTFKKDFTDTQFFYNDHEDLPIVGVKKHETSKKRCNR